MTNLCSHKNLYTNGHNILICDSQNLQTVQMCLNRWAKQTVSGTSTPQNTTQQYKTMNHGYTKQLGWISRELYWVKKKPIPKGCKLYDSICHSGNDKIIEMESRLGSEGMMGGKEDVLLNQATWRALVIELFRVLTVGVDTRTYTCDKTVYNQTHTHTQVQIKWGKFE